MAIRESVDAAVEKASADLSKDTERKEETRKGLSTALRVAPAAAQAADGIMTYRNLKSGGQEHNPLLRGLAKKSPEGLLALKVAQGIGTQALANHIEKKYGDRKVGRIVSRALALGSTVQGGIGAVSSYKNRHGRDVKGKR